MISVGDWYEFSINASGVIGHYVSNFRKYVKWKLWLLNSYYPATGNQLHSDFNWNFIYWMPLNNTYPFCPFGDIRWRCFHLKRTYEIIRVSFLFFQFNIGKQTFKCSYFVFGSPLSYLPSGSSQSLGSFFDDNFLLLAVHVYWSE